MQKGKYMQSKNDMKLSSLMSGITYNYDQINFINGVQKGNLVLGVGLWSNVNKLSTGLPIDVLNVLLPSRVLLEKMHAVEPKAKLLIILADNFALKLGAEERALSSMVKTYKTQLNVLLKYLKMDDKSQIISASEIQDTMDYKKIEEYVINNMQNSTGLSSDESYLYYLSAQTAIIRYVYEKLDVGIKISWIDLKSIKSLKEMDPYHVLKQWDELKFDALYNQVFQDNSLQYLYTKCGIGGILQRNGEIQVEYTPPYYSGSRHIKYMLGNTKSVEHINDINHKPLLKHFINLNKLYDYFSNLGLVEPIHYSESTNSDILKSAEMIKSIVCLSPYDEKFLAQTEHYIRTGEQLLTFRENLNQATTSQNVTILKESRAFCTQEELVLQKKSMVEEIDLGI